jgi:hypothetical protein
MFVEISTDLFQKSEILLIPEIPEKDCLTKTEANEKTW